MTYDRICEGIFCARPNRFIAIVEIEGVPTECHVKNTGRCRELLVNGTKVYLQKSDNPSRKTQYDLIAVKKGERLINMDSQAPNLAVKEFLPKLFGDTALIRAETVFGSSRFDFYVETADRKIFVEVKGVTLEEEGIARFPDAPTERGIKHLQELCTCVKQGYEAYVLFVIQMKNVRYFTPNDVTHPAFGEALREAHRQGVKILARDCVVTASSMRIADEVEVCL